MQYESFRQAAKNKGIEVTLPQFEQLTLYCHQLQQVNHQINLTAITDTDEIFEKHFLDSMLILKHIENYQSILDVGTGAGFPGLVCKIINPTIELTLVEPTTKKTVFLEGLCNLLGFNDVIIKNQRIEELPELREQFDVVTARAVARLDILSELCIPYVKVGGKFIALKGSSGIEEAKFAEVAIATLGAVVQQIDENHILDKGEIALRHNIIISKNRPTPKQYPRAYSKIKKKPL